MATANQIGRDIWALMKKTSLLPSSPFALRFAAIMHRAPTTAWNKKKEIDKFREMSKTIQDEHLTLVERYYKANWPPKTGHNHLRHDLATLINNWSGEVDRARIWCEQHPIRTERKVIPMPPTPSEPPKPLTEAEQIAADRFWADYQQRKQMKGTA